MGDDRGGWTFWSGRVVERDRGTDRDDEDTLRGRTTQLVVVANLHDTENVNTPKRPRQGNGKKETGRLR